jgi:hypothetical protein
MQSKEALNMRYAKWMLAAALAVLAAGCVDGNNRYSASPYRSDDNRNWNSAHRDYDHDGIPNRYDRDANGDHVPDRYQGR